MKASPNTIAFQKLVFITSLSSEFYYLCYGSDCHYSHSENFYFNDSMNAYLNFFKTCHSFIFLLYKTKTLLR